MKGQTEQLLSISDFLPFSTLSQAPVATGHELLEFPHKEEVVVFQGDSQSWGFFRAHLRLFPEIFFLREIHSIFSIAVLYIGIAIPLLLSHW